MGDTAAHLARANNADRPDLRHSRPRKLRERWRPTASRFVGQLPYTTPRHDRQHLAAMQRGRRCANARLFPGGGQRVHEFRDQGLVVAHESVVGDLEDRGVAVLIDRHDDLGVLHPGEMLDGARDAHGHVELRRDDLAGLADLIVVGRVAGVGPPRARRPRPRPACRLGARSRGGIPRPNPWRVRPRRRSWRRPARGGPT